MIKLVCLSQRGSPYIPTGKCIILPIYYAKESRANYDFFRTLIGKLKSKKLNGYETMIIDHK